MNDGRNPDGTFASGNKISKGRKVGSRNAITQDFLNRLMNKFEEDKTNPVEGMYALLTDPDTNSELKFRIFSKLMDYTNNPALITTDEEGKSEYMELSNDELAQRVKELTSE